jgi:activator of HSP90 ATPase
MLMVSDDPTDSVASRRQVIAGLTAGAAVAGTAGVQAKPSGEILRVEAIHQEVTFKASRERVYRTLTDANEFHKVVLLSGAAQSGMIKATTPTQISGEPGGAFAIFGGFVVGRQIELVPNTRIVQAWRPLDWEAGVYSIVRFELVEHGAGTRLVFTHTGFPVGQAEHLTQGWRGNYWQPMEKVLAT